MVREIFEYRRIQIGIDDSGKNLNKYEFSSNIICSECGGTFRRQKIYIGKPYETIQWSCIQHIKDISKCSMKAVKENVIKDAFIIMWNKLISNYKEILLPLLESLRNLRMDRMQEEELEELNNKIMELTEQGHVLSRVATKGYIDPAIFIERQNALNIEISATKKKRNQILDNNGFEKEIEGTLRIIETIEDNLEITEEYQKDLFIRLVDKVIIGENHEITFRLINGLELTEDKRK